jgi:peptide deformylase
MSTAESPVRRASDAFVAEFTRWRLDRGMSKKQLAAAMGFDPSYVSHVEAHRHRPTEDFAKRAEAVLQAGGAIWRCFREYDAIRASSRIRGGALPGRDPPVPEQWLPPGTGLVVDRENARLSYVDGAYRCTVRRTLYNAGREPVTRYLVRVAVDRYPGQSERSNRHHRSHPLTFEELNLVASCAGEPMLWRPKTDRDAFKEAWLLFENQHSRFPLYPGQRTTIEYTYHVGADKWGPWFQRAVRLPTRRLRIEVDLPLELRPVVWGLETSMSSEAMPLRTPIEQAAEGDRAVFSWSTDNPPMHARYRLEWRFRNTEQTPAASNGKAVGVRMREAGVVQRDAEILRTPARWFDLPREASEAHDALARLHQTLERVAALHRFSKGLGLAAPQIGVARAAAIVRPAGEHEPIVLLNPRVVGASPEVDQQFEGCLSFFDVRGLVARPLRLTVESALLSGERIRITYERALARLVAHEVDHLDGQLYVDRMTPDAPLVPLDEYGQTGRPWLY